LAKWVYLFHEGNSSMRDLLGSKGAGIAEMTRTGVPVPPGFTITTETCQAYYENGKQFPKGMWEQVLAALNGVEQQIGKKFGDPANPLLVSVRSGAKFSMPGMMDTVLNLGLNKQTLEGLAKLTNNPRFAADVYRRFVQLFGKIVLGVDGEKLEHVMNEAKGHNRQDTDLSAEELSQITEQFKAIIKQDAGVDFAEDPYEQLRMAIGAVFGSWTSRRAVDYRRLNKVADNLGTAVNIQAMVFGNMGDDSATGVAFTRNPSTGDTQIYGEYLVNAQGEDVIVGVRIPRTMAELQREMPEVYEQFIDIARKLETHYKDVQDVEFTIERGKLWMLQTRTCKRTSYASLRFAVDFLDEGLISEREALLRIQPTDLEQCFVPKLPRDLNKRPITVGLPASSGVASGVVVFDQEIATTLIDAGEKIILVRTEIAPEDIGILVPAQGVLTARGGMTSHAAVASRGLGKPCVAGAGEIRIDYKQRLFSTSKEIVREGDVVTIDGHTGCVYLGRIDPIKSLLEDPYLLRLASLAWSVNPSDYVEDASGTLWLLRDIIRDRAASQFSMLSSSIRRSLMEENEYQVKSTKYISFIQPPDNVISDILHIMHWNNNTDTVTVAWGIAYNLLRLLQNAVGIGNHHLAIRPLNDPGRSFVIPDTRLSISLESLSTLSSNYNPVYQLIGIEFFGINRLLRSALPWAYVQWWGVVRIESDLRIAWRLDKVNPKGESLIPGRSELTGFLIMLDNECLSIAETRKWYNELREREFGWSWYRENNTSWREVVNFLQQTQAGQITNHTTLIKLRDIGLLTWDFQLTSKGKSLFHEQTASDRRHITFQGRELPNER